MAKKETEVGQPTARLPITLIDPDILNDPETENDVDAEFTVWTKRLTPALREEVFAVINADAAKRDELAAAHPLYKRFSDIGASGVEGTELPCPHCGESVLHTTSQQKVLYWGQNLPAIREQSNAVIKEGRELNIVFDFETVRAIIDTNHPALRDDPKRLAWITGEVDNEFWQSQNLQEVQAAAARFRAVAQV